MGLRRALQFARGCLAHPWVLGPAVGVLIILFFLAGLMEVAELKLHDVLLRLRGPIPHRREVVVVDVSEKTFDELEHAWPFPRAWFAQAIENIQAAKPKTIGLDILFLEPSVFGPGDAVNRAARLQSATKEVRRDIVISESSVKELKGRFPLRPAQEILVKGGEQPVQVYSVDAGQVAEEPELRTLVDATLQTLTGTRAPSLTRHG